MHIHFLMSKKIFSNYICVLQPLIGNTNHQLGDRGCNGLNMKGVKINNN